MSRTTYVELLDTKTIIATDTPELWSEAHRLPHAEGKRRHREHAKQGLLKLLKQGDTVYTVLRHVSRSGMQRRIDVYTIKNNEPVYLSGYAATLLDWSQPRSKQGITVDGCGMDMGFHLVHSLSYALFGVHEKKPLKHCWL